MSQGPYADDIAFAQACARGETDAIARFESHLEGEVRPCLAQIDGSAHFADEMLQQLRIKLLVGQEGQPPKVETYQGRGAFGSWVRVVAVRMALSAKRGEARQPRQVDLADAPEPLALVVGDAELENIRFIYREQFHQAFRAALRELSPRDRTILRLHFVDGMNTEGIGRIYLPPMTRPGQGTRQPRALSVVSVYKKRYSFKNVADILFWATGPWQRLAGLGGVRGGAPVAERLQ